MAPENGAAAASAATGCRFEQCGHIGQLVDRPGQLYHLLRAGTEHGLCERRALHFQALSLQARQGAGV